MPKIKVTNQEKYHDVFEVNVSQLSHSQGRYRGSISIDTANDKFLWTGEHGYNDYEDDYGFILDPDDD